jgi:pyruvate/2-oxoglutarate dehydrogenase complex dihydrolipoamide acyltransferase (E2) component
MSTKVIMPQLGESVVEGTVSRWLKAIGDPIQEFEAIVEVSTDKVDTEIPAPAAGVLLAIYTEAGETVEAGTTLAVIGQAGEAPPPTDDSNHTAAAPAQSAPFQQTRPVEGASQGRNYSGPVTPVVARMAAEHQIDLSQITGTGRQGRITKQDVERYLEQGPAPAIGQTQAATDGDLPPWEQPGEGNLFKPTVEYADEASTPPAPQTQPTTPAPAPTSPPPAEEATYKAPPPPLRSDAGMLVSLTPMRKAIAEHMVLSKRTSPHVTTVFEVDLSAVIAHQQAQKDAFAQSGVKLTLTAYFAAATVHALVHNPYLNAQWTDLGIHLHHAVNLGIAVAVNEGLLVPVIRNAQDLNLMGLARAVNDLAHRARHKQLSPDEIKGGTFTISNHGVNGSLFATPIINQPQVGILGVGMLEKRVKVIDDAIAIRPCSYLSLTFDHRVVDGANADAFMRHIKDRLEHWD